MSGEGCVRASASCDGRCDPLGVEPRTAVGDQVRQLVFRAIFDPGRFVGMKGDRELTEWQTDAVMLLLARAGLLA